MYLMNPIDEKEHPFPNEELMLILKWNKEEKIPIEEIAVMSNLIHKYCKLRSYVFQDFKVIS
jgi:hypothetical protein